MIVTKTAKRRYSSIRCGERSVRRQLADTSYVYWRARGREKCREKRARARPTFSIFCFVEVRESEKWNCERVARLAAHRTSNQSENRITHTSVFLVAPSSPWKYREISNDKYWKCGAEISKIKIISRRVLCLIMICDLRFAICNLRTAVSKLEIWLTIGAYWWTRRRA